MIWCLLGWLPLIVPLCPQEGRSPMGVWDQLTTVQTEPEPEPTVVPEPWDRLADCESGDWIDRGASFVEGSARWDWAKPGTDLPPWGTRLHHGGLQWNPDTWNWLAPGVLGPGAPSHAYDATPAQEIAVAEHYVALEQSAGRGGWGPWPTCSRLIGLPR